MLKVPEIASIVWCSSRPISASDLGVLTFKHLQSRGAQSQNNRVQSPLLSCITADTTHPNSCAPLCVHNTHKLLLTLLYQSDGDYSCAPATFITQSTAASKQQEPASSPPAPAPAQPDCCSLSPRKQTVAAFTSPSPVTFITLSAARYLFFLQPGHNNIAWTQLQVRLSASPPSPKRLLQ